MADITAGGTLPDDERPPRHQPEEDKTLAETEKDLAGGDIDERQLAANDRTDQLPPDDRLLKDRSSAEGTTQPQSEHSSGFGQFAATGSRLKKWLLKRKWWVLIISGLGGIVTGLFIFLFLFLLGFKLNHIEKLFLDYRFAVFHRQVARMTRAAIEESRGLADENVDPNKPVDLNGPLEEQMSSIDMKESLKPITEDGSLKVRYENGKFAGIADSAGRPVDLRASDVDYRISQRLMPRVNNSQVLSTGVDVDATYNIGRTIDPVDEQGKTEEQIEKQVDDNLEKDVREPDRAKLPTDELQKQADEVEAKIKEGKDPQTAVDEVVGEGRLEGVGRFSSDIAAVVLFCIAYDIYHTSVEQFANKKTGALMRSASSIFTAADGQKQGKLSGSQVAAYNKKLDGFEDSAAYQRRVGQPVTSPDLADEAKPFVTATGTVFEIINKVASGIGPVAGPACKVLLNPVVQGVLAGGTIAALIASGGTYAAIKAGVELALGVFVIEYGKHLIKDAIANYANTGTTGREKGGNLTNHVDAGTDLMAQEYCRNAGCRRLDPEEANSLQQAAVTELNQSDQSQGLAYEVFNLNNPDAAVPRLLALTPTTPNGLLQKLAGFSAAALNPWRWAAQGHRLLTSGGGLALAAGPDPYGIPQYGLTDAEITRWSIRDNARWVEDYNRTHQPTLDQQFSRCFEGKLGTIYAKTGEVDNSLGFCNDHSNPDSLIARYRVYRLQRRAVQGLVLMGNNQAYGGNAAIAPPSDSGPKVPVGTDAAQLARQILARPDRISFTTGEARQEVEDAANGKEVHVPCIHIERATTPLNPVLLGSLLSISDKYQIGIGYLANGCHANGSYHYTGDAVDLNTINGQATTGSKPLDWQFLQDLSAIVPDGSSYGQASCGVAAHVHPVHRVGIFDDTCNHLHIQVPR